MSIAKMCKALCRCKKSKEVRYTPDTEPQPPLHTGQMPITVTVGQKGHHQYTSTEVDIHEALRTEEIISGRLNE